MAGEPQLVRFPDYPVGTKPEVLPDIYYIVLEGYGSQAVLAARCGIDNGEFVTWLDKHGFYVASASHSNYAFTAFSMASSLNGDYLYAMGSYDTSSHLIEDNRIERFLKGIGYTLVRFPTHVVDRNTRFADIRIGPRPARQSDFLQLLVRSTVPWAYANSLKQTAAAIREHTLQGLQSLSTIADLPQPTFALVHLLAPDEPFVFDRNGNQVSPERIHFRYDNHEAWRRYEDQLLFLNGKLQEAIQVIVRRSAVPPIIVVQGDHGPRAGSSWNRTAYFGILNAYLVPAPVRSRLYPSVTPINTFRLILDAYFGTQLGLLPDRSYTLVNRPTGRDFRLEANPE